MRIRDDFYHFDSFFSVLSLARAFDCLLSNRLGARILLLDLSSDPLLPHSMGPKEHPNEAQREREQPRRGCIGTVIRDRLKGP